jgi:xanthine/uracil/vitamin C permease (AzgA family)
MRQNDKGLHQFLERYFQIGARNSTVRMEIAAGFTMYVASIKRVSCA